MEKINPGESREITLVASKKMTENSTGTFTNVALIEDNKQSKAEIIISVSTGIIVYISIGIILLTMIILAIIIASKKGLKIRKMPIIMLLFTSIIILEMNYVQVDAEIGVNSLDKSIKDEILRKAINYRTIEAKRHYFWWPAPKILDGEGPGGTFGGGPTGFGRCQSFRKDSAGDPPNTGVWYSCNDIRDITIKGISSITVKQKPNVGTLQKLDAENAQIPMKVAGTDYIFGPFNAKCDGDSNSNYICNAYNLNGKVITNKTVCDSNGNSIAIKGSGNKTFYIKIPISGFTGLSKVELGGQSKGIYELEAEVYGDEKYTPELPNASKYQKVSPYPDFVLAIVPWKGEAKGDTMITWTKFGGCLEIIKQDFDNKNIKLSNVKIQITGNGINKTLTTDENGRIFIENLVSNQTYTITEVENPYYGYLTIENGKKVGDVKIVKSGAITTLQLNNIKHTGNLKIVKRDSDNANIKLQGVSFKIKNSSGQYIITIDENNEIQKAVTGKTYVSNVKNTTNSEEATEFKVDSDGIIEINNLPDGNYVIEETNVGKDDNYELDGNYIKWSTGGTGITENVVVARQSSADTKIDSASQKATVVTVYNTRKYIKLSGKVWQDIEANGKTQEERNGLYGDETDQNLEGIQVQLKHTNGNVIKQTLTDKNGEYTFEKIIIDELKNYYIEFQYNGMNYQSVEANADKYQVQSMETVEKEVKARAQTQNSNRASEGSNRETFNNAYSIISNGKSNEYDLTYKVSDYTSKLSFRKDGNESVYNYGYEGNLGAPIDGVDEQYIIKANTYNTYGGPLTAIKTESDIRKNSIIEIADINLGIEKREMPDMSVVKDLNSAKITINGKEHIYKYADRFNKDLYAENGGNGFDMSPQVKLSSKYGTTSYTRALYPSDIYYKDCEDKKDGEQLKVQLTYKIGIKNSSSTIISVINEIEDYYDSKYETDKNKITVGKEINNNGDIKEASKLNYEFVDSGSDKYNKIKIKEMNLIVQPQEENYIYVQLEVKEEQIIELLGNDTKLDNIAEISSYSTKDKNNKNYAGIDQDSQPGNTQIENTKTYEDDTDKARGITFTLQENRKVSGIVFMDSTTKELKTGEIRQGDGMYTEGEIGIPEVTVTIVNTKTQKIANKYNEEKQKWEPAITKTNEKGEYNIEGIIPDEYKIIYTWGGQKYTDKEGQEKQITVQDYKGTIYQDLDRKTNLEWYKTKEPRYSDAIDNYDERLKIDEQTTIMTNNKKQSINNIGGEIQLESGEKTELITNMDATTPEFKVNIEYNTINTDHKNEYVIENGKIKMNGPYAVKKDEYKNEMQNMDFGIVERARQVLSLDKRINEVKLTLANGTTIVNTKVNEDGTLENPVKHTVYIPNSNGDSGQVKFELDSEIVQGSKIEVGYELKVVNISELEYINKEYYIYGKGHGENEEQLVELQANKVIDYLNDNITTDIENEQIGQYITDTNKKNNLISQGLLENSSKMRNLLNSTKGIALIDKLSQKLKPLGTNSKESTSISLTLKGQKIISSNEESLLANNAEIIEIKKTGGSSLIAIPGNYIPNTNVSEYDNSKSETVEIIPPTGIGYDYIAYTLLAISSLGILLCGIILIKKKILG